MLVLTRRQRESVVFDVTTASGERVSFSAVVWSDGNRLKVGIDAPPEVHVRRGELTEEKREAAESL